MKRKSTSVRIEASREAVEKVLKDVPSFVTNWPYVVRVSTRNGLTAEIMLPRFLFKFRDVYRFEHHSDYSSYIYDGRGEKSHLTLVVTLKQWQKGVEAALELSYSGRGEFWLGKTLQDLVEGIGKSLRELAESEQGATNDIPQSSGDVAIHVDFSDPMSVANFLAKSRMVHGGLHVIGNGGLFDLVGELRGTMRDRILYISGVTSDGTSSFKVLLDGSRILAIEYRGPEGVEVIKVEGDEDARKAAEIAAKISGPYMVNVWVPIGGV
ncbi:hypothetical protein [Thermococcus sp.]|uniref:hypothetical protein n=1 Tax=Thermococcus sp. TaxID=35749 RepID=UPI002628102F|nr:hypothetical protein [Thermococcus sp.]